MNASRSRPHGSVPSGPGGRGNLPATPPAPALPPETTAAPSTSRRTASLCAARSVRFHLVTAAKDRSIVLFSILGSIYLIIRLRRVVNGRLRRGRNEKA